MAKILIADDEPSMLIGLRDNLSFEGYETVAANNGEEALAIAAKEKFDLIILDVMMPKMSGFDVCKSLRKRGINTPVIFLTAKGEEIDRVIGLEIGADDYVTKPFSLRELIARVKVQLRRKEFSGSEEIEKIIIGKLELNFSSYSAFENGKPVQLSHKEFEILKYLWMKKNQTCSRDDLLTNIWGYDESPTTRTVDNFVIRLRNKIEKDPNHPQIIITVHGIGYKLLS